MSDILHQLTIFSGRRHYCLALQIDDSPQTFYMFAIAFTFKAFSFLGQHQIQISEYFVVVVAAVDRIFYGFFTYLYCKIFFAFYGCFIILYIVFNLISVC